MMMNYLVILEKGEQSWGAYSPDVPGCIATGQSRDDAARQYKEALEFHLEGLRAEGLPLPVPRSEAGMVSIAA